MFYIIYLSKKVFLIHFQYSVGIDMIVKSNASSAIFNLHKQPPEVFLEISQTSQENTCARVTFLIKLQALGLQLYEKRDSSTDVFLWILQNF